MAPSTTSTELRTASRKGRSARKVGGIVSTRWPRQRAATNHVAVQVKDTLAPVAPLVDDHPVTAFAETKLFCDVTRCEHDEAEQRGVLRLRFVKAGQVCFGNDQGVLRTRGANVAKREHRSVLEENLSRNLLCDNLAEE